MTIGLVTSHRSASKVQPLFSTPILWAIRVLAWLAFLITSYLALKSLGHSVSDYCPIGSADCDLVQTSSWSVWLRVVPVAILGLACYSTLAGLSVAAGFANARSARWISSALLMFSLLAALSGLWFTGLQIFALNKYCIWCMSVHACGLAVAGLVLWGTLKGREVNAAASASQLAMPALKAGMPNTSPAAKSTLSPVPTRRAAPAPVATRPMFGMAVGGAFALIALMIGGQLLFPASGSTSERVVLREPIRLDGDDGNSSADPQTHVAHKPINDPNVKPASANSAAGTGTDLFPTNVSAGGDTNAKADPEKSAGTNSEDATPPKKRIVTFLDGALSLDVYRFPVLGSREAPNFVLEFVSYDCAHCRHTHKMIHRALEQYGDQVGVIVVMMPGGVECNKLVTDASKSISGACVTAKMAMAVGSMEPEKFAQFHDWLMENRDGKEKPPTPAQVVQRAHLTVGRERITKISPTDFQKQVELNVDLYSKIQRQRGIDPVKGGLPLIIVGTVINAGTPANEEKFIQSWQEELGLKPAAASAAIGL